MPIDNWGSKKRIKNSKACLGLFFINDIYMKQI
jgi:hypothetical protein